MFTEWGNAAQLYTDKAMGTTPQKNLENFASLIGTRCQIVEIKKLQKKFEKLLVF